MTSIGPLRTARARPSEIAESLAKVVGRLPAGEVRVGQLEMAEAVRRTLSEGGTLAVAAGTGTGKSFAYLVPAALSSKRVVVATATKALQDQLAGKDLPLLRDAMGGTGRTRLRWAVLKGRSNYLCRQRLAELEELGRQETLGQLADDAEPTPATAGRRRRGPGRADTVAAQVVRIVAWSASTRSGDRAELDFEPDPRAWGNVSVTPDECPGAHRCSSGADCYSEKARADAARADVVVVNLHLLAADLRSDGAVLPEYDALVVDEAHELEDVLAASLGVDVTPGRLRALAAAARAAAGGAGAGGRARADAVVEDVLAVAVRLEAALEAAPEARLASGLGPDVGPVVELASGRLQRLEAELRRASGPGAAPSPPGHPPGARTSGESSGPRTSGASSGPRTSGASSGRAPSGVAERTLRVLLAVERCRQELDRCLRAGDDEVVWVAGGERPALRSAPLEVRSVMSAGVFEHVPVVLTSATMAPGLAERLGAPAAEVTELDVGSPFDYANNALVYCAVGLPDRRSASAEAAIHEEIELLVKAAGGRTLALFTSRRAMEEAARQLRRRIEWPIHLQGELPKAALLRAFSEEESSCLFATMGFWQGVDVPGPALSLVVIDRLPFPRPDDPLIAARRQAAGAGGFRTVDLPRAATLLAQGAGRLIRTASDRGVVAVLDPRLATASYSGYLVGALPRMRRTRRREEAVAFLRGLHG